MKKKLLLLITSILVSFINCDAQGTATWNGSVSNDWNDAANWTWINGSGVPGINDDVIINNEINNVHVSSNTIANCKNLKLGEGINNYVSLRLEDSATLNVYGNITQGYDGKIVSLGPLNKSTTLNFLGTGDQMAYQNELLIGNININKPTGNVYLKNEERYIYVYNTLNFKNPSVPVNTDPAGNLYLNLTSIVFPLSNPQAKITTTAYQDNEIPPHIIINTNLSAIYFTEKFTGNKFIPISNYITSFNPVTIHSNAESWFIKLWSPAGEDDCDSIPALSGAVRRTWTVTHLTNMTSRLNSDNPEKVSFTFHVNNIGMDVPSGFNPNHNKLNIWRKNHPGPCWSKIGSSLMPTTGYVTVETPYLSEFYKFMIVPDTATSPTEVGINNIENTLSNIAIYPNPVNNELTFDLSSFSNRQLKITISDALGKVLYKTTLVGNKPNTYKVNMQNFSTGLYFIRLSDEAFTETKKVIKR